MYADKKFVLLSELQVVVMTSEIYQRPHSDPKNFFKKSQILLKLLLGISQVKTCNINPEEGNMSHETPKPVEPLLTP